ncbi:MAG TPA: hypothetical protein VJZ27_02810, partial [Aggregatilineales bacterium]|nr:hypothetical protein [Aggregatilineales bacterium]
GSPTIAYNSVAAMPKRYSRYLPRMKLYADEMTLETSTFCPGLQRVGRFEVGNIGYPGGFTAVVEPAESPLGPPVTVSREQVRSGQDVEVFVDTTGLDAGLYLVYINVRTAIGGDIRAQNIRAFVIIRDSIGTGC